MTNTSIICQVSRRLLRSYVLPAQFSSTPVTRRWLCAAASLKQSESSESTKKASEVNETSETIEVKEASTTDAAVNEGPQLNAEQTKKILQLTNDLHELKDKYQRTLADRENVRRRLEKQVSDAKLYGIQSFCKDLLEVSDVFRKALESVSPEDFKEGGEQLRGLYDGLSMTETQMLNVFKRHGLRLLSLDIGSRFDPSSQEAMFEVAATGDLKPGDVAHILRHGWQLHDRCIRSAQVGVVKD